MLTTDSMSLRPENERILGDETGTRMLHRPMREDVRQGRGQSARNSSGQNLLGHQMVYNLQEHTFL